MTGAVSRRATSELVAKHELDLPWPVNHAVATASGHTEILIAWPPINAAKGVTVEGIRYVGLEQNGVPLPNHGSFDDRKVLVLISRTSPPGDSRRQIPEDVAAAASQRSGARIDKGSTVGCLRSGGVVRCEYTILLSATAIPAAYSNCLILGGRPVCGVCRENPLPRNQAEPIVTATVSMRRCVGVNHRGRPDLVAVNSADLPPACNLAGDAMVQVLLAGTKRQFVQIAQYESMRNVLVADGLLASQIVRVLRTKDIGVESCESGKRRIR